ncbi:MAG TPA: IS4 family transposase [Sphingobium sp.]|uniref:IS4 family transposase n=1 Tax=Sphingobium sp. TaxID=1912891 RepID=UPI002ED28F85
MRVGRMVRQLFGGGMGFVHGSRLKAFLRVVEGVLKARRLTPATVGRNISGRLRPKHGIKCIDRLLGNNRLWREREPLFRALATRLLARCSRPVILVDWTQLMAGMHEILVAATPIGGRALPIYVEVHPLKKLGNTEVEERFLLALSRVLPAGCRPVVISDAGFKGPFFDAVLARGWEFVGRVRGTAKALPSWGGPTISKEEFYAKATVVPRDLGRYGLFVGDPLPCRLILVRKRRKPGPKLPPPKCKEERELRQAALDPWLLATSLESEDAAAIVALYARRMQIEETFRDAKNHRFGWCLSDARPSTNQRALVLLLVAAFAFAIATLVGLSAEAAGAHRAYQANTSRKRVLSLLVLASAMLQRGDYRFMTLASLRNALRTIAGRANA